MKEKKKIKYLNEIAIICFVLIVCACGILKNKYTNLDEIWNFNFAKNIADGLIPYKDFNMIMTPLLPIICGNLMKVFGVEMFTMRVFSIILLTAIFFIAYLILKKITNNDVALVGLVLILLGFKNILWIDYNYMTLFVGLILTYIELYRKKDFFSLDIRYDFTIGVIAGLAVCLKQTTGLAIACACIGYKIFKIRKKEDVKTFFKIAFVRFLGVCVPIVLLVSYLLINNCMKDFIDYTILGVTEFSNKKLYIELIRDKKYYSLLAIMIPIVLIYTFIKLLKKDTKNEMYILFAYGIATSIVIYPISDVFHFTLGILISFLLLIYSVYELTVEAIKNNKVSKKVKLFLYGDFSFILIFTVLTIVIYSANDLWKEYIQVDKEKELSHFNNIVEDKLLKERIKVIEEYILSEKRQGTKVYILAAEAVIYNMPLDIYYKDYDLFLIGNLGKNGEEKIINRIKEEKNCVYLINNEYANWQTPLKITTFIENNLEKIGEVSIYDIYELKP